MNRAVDDPVSEADLLRLRDPLRRYLARVVTQEDELEDLLQETLLRVWEVRERVGRSAAASYAVVTARNLVQTRERALEVSQRHAHRLHEPPTVDGPEVETLRAEEQRAAGQVLRTLRQDDLTVLSEDGPAQADRSARRRSRLARARARARVDYLLRLRRLDLPTADCRPVLEALSTGDRRQQERVAAAAHLVRCRVCASCVRPLLARERRLFSVAALPLLVLVEPLRRTVERAPRTTATVAAAAGVALAVGAGAAVTQGGQDEGPPRAAPAAVPAAPPPAGGAAPGTAPGPVPGPATGAAPGPVPGTAPGAVPGTAPGAAPGGGAAGDPAGRPPLDPALGRPPTAGEIGRPVVTQSVQVLSVPADEGFWVGPEPARQTYVRLPVGVGESTVQIRPGTRLSFSGTVQPLADGVAEGLEESEGLGVLLGQQAYVLVAPEGVTVVPG